ncbi:flippase-like domain-containing protein [Vicingaceae bacterium]|nr:flippase-like domain-containing protein [Vicingaceae bacterium]MDC1452042.1 flippase-like domain-containing protein [Vicingaceae bacterium]
MKSILSFLKIALPLAFGAFLIWYVFKDLTQQEKEELYTSFAKANYFWIFLSISFGVLSHMSRAIRWKYTIQPLGKTPGFWNSFFTVMIGYVANLALPRLGEVTRPGLLGKYEGLPFNKLFGTIVAERVADLVILGSIMAGIVFVEFDMLKELLFGYLEQGSGNISIEKILIIAGVAIAGLVALFFLMLSKSDNPISRKIRELVRGIFEGLISIVKMENKGYFLMHTAFIWIMYVGMFWVCFFCLEETSSVPLAGIVASFVMGSLAIVFVQGGLGVFPLAIMNTLLLYGVSKSGALALGWILWTSQTLMVIVLGMASIPLLSFVNRNKKIESATSN